MKPIRFILPILFLQGCVQPYDFESTSYEKVLVVDGSITDQSGPYEVILSYTYAIGDSSSQVVSDASVWVEDGSGNTTNFYYSEDGIYLSPDGFQGTVNESYQLYIEMADGSIYTSTAQTLIASPPIDTIYAAYAELPDADDEENVGGIQFYIDTHDDTGNAKYFRYSWDEAYKIVTPYPSYYDVLEDTTIVRLDTSLGICYQENVADEILYGTTTTSAGNQLLEFPVRFVEETEQTLRVRYTINVEQYAISESAYLYFKKLAEMNESGGSLFDQQTGSLYGNVYSETDEDDGVLGYFEVAGKSSKRKFFNKSDFDDQLDVASFPYSCSTDDMYSTTSDSALYYQNRGYRIYSLEFQYINLYPKQCSDCTYYADNTPPDYWIDD